MAISKLNFMGAQIPRRTAQLAFAGGLALALAGCGGSAGGPGGDGGATGGSTGTGSSPSDPSVTATFLVDTKTGQVQITQSKSTNSNSGAAKSLAVFSGDTVGFVSSQLVDAPGTTSGLRALQVAIKNNFGLPIGVDTQGNTTKLRLVFSPCVNLSGAANLRPQTQVSTWAGSGSVGVVDGSSSSASFNQPVGLALDNSGNLYVADSVGKIRKISNGYVSTLAGGGVAGTDGYGSAAGFTAPFGIAVSPVDGAIYVSDSTGNKVRRITPDGRVTTVAGTGATGAANGSGSTATFNGPQGIAIDSSGAIYIADSNGNRIRKIVTTGNPLLASGYTVTTLAGGASGDADGATPLFAKPAGLAVDSSGYLYVADYNNNKIKMVDTATGYGVTIAGTGGAGTNDGTGLHCQFNHPRGIVCAGNGLLVSDYTTNEIRQVSLLPGGSRDSASNWIVGTLAGNGSGSANGDGTVATFNRPSFMASTDAGTVYVADFSNHLIRRIVPTNGLFPIGVSDGSSPTDAVQLTNPDGIQPDGPAGQNLPYIEYPGNLQSGATSDAKYWSFNIPSSVTSFQFSVTVIADTPVPTGTDSGSGVGSKNVAVRTIAGNPSQLAFNDGSATSARFYIYFGQVAVDPSGITYVCDEGNNVIRRIDQSGTVSTIAGGNGFADGYGNVARFTNPIGITYSPDGSLYVCDYINQRIRRIGYVGGDPSKATSWYVTTIIGTGAAGGGYAGTMTGDVATIDYPSGIAVNATGTALYFTENSGNRVRMASVLGDPSVASNWRVSLLGGDTSATSGAAAELDGSLNGARFNGPAGISITPSGNLVVCDNGGNRIRQVTFNGSVTTLAGSSAGFADGPALSAQFSGPDNVAVDKAGAMYITDLNNNRIRCLQNGVATTIAGTGTVGHLDGTGDVAHLSSPSGLAITPQGNLIFSSLSDYSVRTVERIFNNP